jgi:hypothetical protein
MRGPIITWHICNERILIAPMVNAALLYASDSPKFDDTFARNAMQGLFFLTLKN